MWSDATAMAIEKPSDEALEQAIQRGLDEAKRKRDADPFGVADRPYFAPRSLGATAPHDCTIWAVDLREPDDTEQGSAVRRLDDPSLESTLDDLLQAGLKVRLPRTPR